MIHIEIEDLVGNAFVGYLQETGKRTLSMQKIEMFANNVVEDLKSKKIEVVLELSRNKTTEFFNDYSEWFIYLEKENVVILKDNITAKQLIKEFSGYLSLETVVAFRKYDNVKILFLH